MPGAHSGDERFADAGAAVTLPRPLSILQVSTADVAGGAERVARALADAYRARGHRSRLAVGYRRASAPDVTLLRNDRPGGVWAAGWWALERRIHPYARRIKGAGSLSRWLRRIADPANLLEWWRGAEQFHYPGAWHLPTLHAEVPDIIHGHNLHGGYFDLRALPFLSREAPLALTLHDGWLLSGHCAHSFECERWQSGCGQCPDLRTYPPVRRDATAANWRRKQDIYTRSRLYVATPCRWLMDRVERSMLWPGVAGARVIPNGVDRRLFRPASRPAARARLGLPPDVRIILFTASSIRRNPWKDYATLRAAIARVAERVRTRLLFLALGDSGRPETIGATELRFVPFTRDEIAVADHYHAADVFLHAAKADTFPLTVLEAMACGLPVVATAVGGIPEQVEDGQTGLLVAKGDAEALAARTVTLLESDEARRSLGERAAAVAGAHYSLETQVGAYLGWYAEVIADWRRWTSARLDSTRRGDPAESQARTVHCPPPMNVRGSS